MANHQVLLPKMVGFFCCSYSLEQHFYEAKIAPKFGCLQTFFFALFLKSVNLKYNTLVRRADGTNESWTKHLMFQVHIIIFS